MSIWISPNLDYFLVVNAPLLSVVFVTMCCFLYFFFWTALDFFFLESMIYLFISKVRVRSTYTLASLDPSLWDYKYVTVVVTLDIIF